jgi:hypothetical protein
MTVDPKTSAILNLIAVLASAIVAAASEWTTLFGSGSASTIVEAASITVAIVGAINGSLHGVSSAKAGPFVTGA